MKNGLKHETFFVCLSESSQLEQKHDSTAAEILSEMIFVRSFDKQLIKVIGR